MFREEEVEEIVDACQVCGWWVFQHDDWKLVEIGDYRDYSPYRGCLFTDSTGSDQDRKMAV